MCTFPFIRMRQKALSVNETPTALCVPGTLGVPIVPHLLGILGRTLAPHGQKHDCDRGGDELRQHVVMGFGLRVKGREGKNRFEHFLGLR